MELIAMKNYFKLLIYLSFFYVASANAFFFIIPTGKISDLITGAEGNNCVATTSKIGDKIAMGGGKMGEIKSTSGTSTRCTSQAFPIRALIEPVDIPEVQTTFKLDIPVGYEVTTLNDVNRFNRVSSSLIQKETGSGLQIFSFPKHTVNDINEFASKRRAFMLVNALDAKEGPIISSKVNNYPVLQFEVSGSFKDGTDAKYLATIFDGQDEVVKVIMWTKIASYDERKPDMVKTLLTTNGLTAAAHTAIVAEGSLEDKQKKCTQMGLQENSKKFNDCLALLSK
jgi:hypothetical protein